MRKRLRESLRPDVEFRTEDGVLARDLFVRRYCDGGVLAVDMSGRPRRLKLCRNGGEFAFDLPARGVREFPGWRMKFDLPHVRRLEFAPDGTAEVELKQSQTLRLALRLYRGADGIAVNGKTVAPQDECTGLPESFRELYREADLGTLSAGKYVFSLREPAEDYPFLPTAILLGDDLPAYTGRVTQSATLFVPETALKLRLAGVLPPPGDAEVRLDGQSLGWRLEAPYEWLIPDALRGREVEIEVEFSSSLSALFGNALRGSDALSNALRGLFGSDYRGAPAPLEVEFE